MDLSLIADQLDQFASFGKAVNTVFEALGKLFGTEGTTDGGAFDALSSYESADSAPVDDDKGSSFALSSGEDDKAGDSFSSEK